jgi:hypothetical protein
MKYIKLFALIIAVIVYSILEFGLIAPALISANYDELVLLGFFTTGILTPAIYVVAIVVVFKIFKKSKRRKK